MPQTSSVKKSLRQSKTRALRNRRFKLRLKAHTKKFLENPSPKLLSELFSFLDKAVKLNIFHSHKTARLKSSFSQKLKAKTLAKQEATKKTTKTSSKKDSVKQAPAKKTSAKKSSSSAKAKPKAKMS